MIKRKLIKEINSGYCTDSSVQLMPDFTDNLLIIDADKVLCFKEKELKIQPQIFEFEYNKLYLNVRDTVHGVTIHENYFFKRREKSFYLDIPLKLDNKHTILNEIIMNRKEIEELFDSSNYESFYILDCNGIILYAKSKNDGVIIDRKIIPSDQEIIKMDRDNRIAKCKIAYAINGLSEPVSIQTKSISQIKNFQIYGPILPTNMYSNIVITSKNQEFTAKWFKLDFVEQDKFRVTISEIPIILPLSTIDDVLEYVNNYTIGKTPEPILLETKESTKKTIESIPNNISSRTVVSDNNYCDETKNGSKSVLQKVLDGFKNII